MPNIAELLFPGFIAGIVGLITAIYLPAHWLPIKRYVAAGSVGVMAISAFLIGSNTQRTKYEKLLDQQRITLEETKAKSAEVSSQVVVKYVDRVKTVEVLKNDFKNASGKITSEYYLPNYFVSLHDGAIGGKLPETAGTIDETAGKVKLSVATEVITGNYLTCNQVREQLLSLQDWVGLQEGLINK